jgi:two-component system, cell cycle response regulator
MEQNNLQPENTLAGEPDALSVAILGFEAIDEESFARFFQVARPYQRKYVAARPADKAVSDILMVNYDSPAALAERDAILAERPQIQVVAVSRGPLTEPPAHHIRGMLFAARVLTTLDKVVVEPLSQAESAQTPIAEPIPAVQPQPVSEVPAPQPQTPTAEQPASTPATATENKITVDKAYQVTAIQPQDSSIQSGTLAPTPVVEAKAVDTSGYRCLVVDDSVAIQKSLEINLATLPQISIIDFADSGESALEKAQSQQYDLIFLDVMMPGIDGYETCTRLRKMAEYKKTPIIMVSGKTSPLDEVKGVMAGCTTYLTKPVQQEAFQKLSIRVLAWLEKQKKP